MIPTKAYAVHNATGDPLRNNSVPVGPGATASRTARALQLSPNSLVKQYPELNVLINIAGILKVDNVHNPVDDALISSIVTTSLLGPVRMTRTHRTFETTTCSLGNSRDLRNCVCPAGCHGGIQRHQGGPPPRSRFRNGTCSKTPASRFWN